MQLGRAAGEMPIGAPRLDCHPIYDAIPPSRLLRREIRFEPGMYGNDHLNDCTCVALANAIRAQAALLGRNVYVPVEKVLSLYHTLGGYPLCDGGVYEPNLFIYQARHGFDIGEQTRYYGLWAHMPTDHFHLLGAVTARLGVGWVGVDLAEADKHGGGIWDTYTPAAYGNPKPGSWGLHSALVWSYEGFDDTSVWEILTWGVKQRATTRWLRSRMTSAHSIVHPQLLGPGGCNWAGLDRERLAEDVARFRG